MTRGHTISHGWSMGNPNWGSGWLKILEGAHSDEEHPGAPTDRLPAGRECSVCSSHEELDRWIVG
jgi:hypothetical protein